MCDCTFQLKLSPKKKLNRFKFKFLKSECTEIFKNKITLRDVSGISFSGKQTVTFLKKLVEISCNYASNFSNSPWFSKWNYFNTKIFYHLEYYMHHGLYTKIEGAISMEFEHRALLSD